MIQLRQRSPWFVAAVTLMVACARPVAITPVPADTSRHVQLDDAAVLALAELLRMEDSRDLDLELVTRHLGDSIPEVRGRAVLAAGRTGDSAAAPLLLHALTDADARVRARAAFALGELGDTSAFVVAGLTGAALSDEAAPAAEAVAALGRLGVVSGRSAIDSLLVRTSTPLPVLHEALLAAWRLPRDAGTLANTSRWTTAADPGTRWRAAYALARGGGPPAVAPLLGVVTDTDDRVRAYAVRGLRASLADSAGLRERALGALLVAVRDSHPHVRINALGLLTAYDEPDRTTPVLAAALLDADANTAVAAAQGLAQAADPRSSGALATAVAPGRPDGLRTAALHAWMRADSAAATSMALSWADSTRWILRMHAARALARAPLQQAVPALHELARDSHYLVASEALGVVRAVADSLPESRRLYIEQLAAAHPVVRAAATRGLARHVGVADMDVLLQAYDRARQDSIRDAAVAAVNALARVRRAGIPVEHSFFLRFGPAGPPRDRVLHRAIIDSIGTPPPTWGEPRPAIELRPIDFYESIIRSYVAPALAGSPLPRAVLTTDHGDIVLELSAGEAPLTVHNFLSLIDSGYYRGTRWHRVVPNFVIQDGDPRGDGSGGPGYAIRDEINPLRYMRGTLGMALSGPDTGGSQYFITHSPQPHLDGGYTVFGQVLSGMDVVDRVVQEDPIIAVRAVRR